MCVTVLQSQPSVDPVDGPVRDLEAPRARRLSGQPVPASARINRTIGAGHRRCGSHFGAGAAAWIQEAERPQVIRRALVAGNPLRLWRHFAPFKAQPGKIVAESLRQFRPAARAVNVLDPQQEFAAIGQCAIVRDDRGVGVAEMERPVRAGGEARA